MSREAIYAGLFGHVSPLAPFVTTSRTLKHWSEVKASQMPALFMAQGNQTVLRDTHMPPRWLLETVLWVYVSTDGAVSPGTVLNPIVDAIDAALADPFPGQPQTLGGLVKYARIEGTIETFEGTLGKIEVARIPVMILTA